MNNKYIKDFYSEVCKYKDDNYKIIVEQNREIHEEWIEFDFVKWEIEETIEELLTQLIKDKTKTFEEKILYVYERICLKYIYDTNVLYFFKKKLTETNEIRYIAVDWYGRIVDDNWRKRRLTHNRRICYELSRIYAKAINEIIKKNKIENCEAFMLGDKGNLHYVVGLSSEKYKVILDVDDFNKIKDLTRLKLGLTIDGITILQDDLQIFTKELEKFNKKYKKELTEFEEAKKKYRESDFIKYLQKIGELLVKNNIDSQGFCEYIRSILDTENIEAQILWKEVCGAPEKRYEKCLLFDYDNKKYLLDSVNRIITEIDLNESIRNNFILELEEIEYPYYGG